MPKVRKPVLREFLDLLGRRGESRNAEKILEGENRKQKGAVVLKEEEKEVLFTLILCGRTERNSLMGGRISKLTKGWGRHKYSGVWTPEP